MGKGCYGRVPLFIQLTDVLAGILNLAQKQRALIVPWGIQASLPTSILYRAEEKKHNKP